VAACGEQRKGKSGIPDAAHAQFDDLFLRVMVSGKPPRTVPAAMTSSTAPPVSVDASVSLAEILTRLEVPASLDASTVMFVCQSGSYMYDLHTPTSDCDYTIIYALPWRDVMRLQRPKGRFSKVVVKVRVASTS
jgi:hypothetical protein